VAHLITEPQKKSKLSTKGDCRKGGLACFRKKTPVWVRRAREPCEKTWGGSDKIRELTHGGGMATINGGFM